MKKLFTAAAAVAATLIAAPAFAHHGQEYPVNACGTDGNTAHMVVTTVGVYGEDPKIKTTVQDTFTNLMKGQSATDHATITPGYVNGLVGAYQDAMQGLVDNDGYGYIHFDFHHPVDTAPSTPGCAP